MRYYESNMKRIFILKKLNYLSCFLVALSAQETYDCYYKKVPGFYCYRGGNFSQLEYNRMDKTGSTGF